MMPSPPSRARAIARRASVTVSMAAESSGIFELDARGQAGAHIGLVGQHLGVAGHHQHIVKCQGFEGFEDFCRSLRLRSINGENGARR